MNLVLVSLLTLVFFTPSWARSSDHFELLRLSDGERESSERLLERQLALVVIEKDCSPCRAYIKTLKTCPDQIRQRIAFVSVNSAAQTKSLSKKIGTKMPLYMIPASSKRVVKATPTTLTASSSRVGALSCVELAALLDVP